MHGIEWDGLIYKDAHWIWLEEVKLNCEKSYHAAKREKLDGWNQYFHQGTAWWYHVTLHSPSLAFGMLDI